MSRSVAQGLALRGAASAIVLSVAATMYVLPFDRNVTGFFWIGDRSPAPAALRGVDLETRPGPGYDGQYFLFQATDPFFRNPRTADSLDNPRYRARRMLYPLLGYLLGGGRPARIPYALVALNVFSAVALVMLARRFARLDGDRGSPWVALLAIAPLGVWVSLGLATADLVGSALFLGALVALAARRERRAAACLGLAGLAREVYGAVIVVFLVRSLVQRRPSAAVTWAVAGLPVLAWNLFVLGRVPAGTTGARENFGPPLLGTIAKIRELAAADPTRHNVFEAFVFLLLLLLAATLLAQWRVDRTHSSIRLGVVPTLFVLVFSRLDILTYHGAHARVFQDLWLVGLLLSGGGAPFARLLRLLLALSAVTSLVYCVNFVTS